MRVPGRKTTTNIGTLGFWFWLVLSRAPNGGPKQREENKKLVAELKKRRDEGENVRIKGGSIISLDHRGAPRNIGAPNTGN